MEGVEVQQEGPAATELIFRRQGPRGLLAELYVGSAVVEASRLRLETNSVERADALRSSVEAACGGLLKHRVREHADPQTLLATVQEQSEAQAGELAGPELLEVLRDFKARHYAGWLDVPLPLLGGKTPREAVRTAAGRRKVALLLKELEHGEAQLPERERTDLSPLRGELGLSE